MKDRPILFSAPMVRAIIDGRKTQTRRVVKGGDMSAIPFNKIPSEEIESLELHGWREYLEGHLFPPCPYGRPGDRLWVRETWASDKQVDNIKPKDLSHGEPIYYAASDGWMTTGCQPIERGRLRPSIFMMPWMSRIILEITNVRVERLHEISDADALSEGVDQTNTSIGGYATERFKRLWQSINGPESWSANPFVWVIEFNRVQP